MSSVLLTRCCQKSRFGKWETAPNHSHSAGPDSRNLPHSCDWNWTVTSDCDLNIKIGINVSSSFSMDSSRRLPKLTRKYEFVVFRVVHFCDCYSEAWELEVDYRNWSDRGKSDPSKFLGPFPGNLLLIVVLLILWSPLVIENCCCNVNELTWSARDYKLYNWYLILFSLIKKQYWDHKFVRIGTVTIKLVLSYSVEKNHVLGLHSP